MADERDLLGPAERALMEDQELRARLRELDDALKRKRAEGAAGAEVPEASVPD